MQHINFENILVFPILIADHSSATVACRAAHSEACLSTHQNNLHQQGSKSQIHIQVQGCKPFFLKISNYFHILFSKRSKLKYFKMMFQMCFFSTAQMCSIWGGTGSSRYVLNWSPMCSLSIVCPQHIQDSFSFYAMKIFAKTQLVI